MVTARQSVHAASDTGASGFQLREMAPCIGAEITGVDTGSGLDDATFMALRDAIHRYGVVVVRDQELTPADELALVKRLGPQREIRHHQTNRFSVPEQPELLVLSNILEDGKPIGLMDAGLMWHTDQIHLRLPNMYTLLYALQVPEKDGKPLGDTLFANVAEAYDALPETMKKRILPLKAVHSYAYHLDKKARLGNLKRPPMTPEQLAAMPDVEHPVVVIHPITGRKCLFVTEGHTARIAGLPADESAALMQELCDHLKRPQFIYRHSWRRHDLLIWDDRTTQHLAICDYGDIPRRMHRGETMGPLPVGVPQAAA